MKPTPILLLTTLLTAWSGTARALPAPVTGGTTSLTFTIDLENLDVDVAPLGAAQVGSSGQFVLPITSGSAQVDPLLGSIHHDGSGIEFSFDGTDVSIEDLEFDFSDGVVNGDLSAGPLSVSTGLFNLVPCIEGGCTGPGGTMPITGFGLFLRPQAADFFENVVFGDDGFDDGDQIALAHIELTLAPPVAEPALLQLLGFGLAAIGLVRRPSA